MTAILDAPTTATPLVRVKNRGYYKDTETGEKYTSVTTILGRNLVKGGLVPWAANTVAKCAMDNLGYLARSARTVADRIDAYDWLRAAADRKKDERGDIGTAVHDLIEARVLGTPVPAEVRDNPEFAPYLAHFEAFVKDWRVEFTASEMVVGNRTHLYAGTLDYLLRSTLIAAALGVPEHLDISGDTKGLALGTLLPTPTGWTTMGEVRVGDLLLGSDGRPCIVTQVSEVHERDCYRVTFDDTSSVICDDEHLWPLTSGVANNLKPNVLSTLEMRRTLRKRGSRQHRVAVTAALDLPAKRLPIDPYVLGCWLGDGKHTSGEITKPDDELFDNIIACGYAVGPPQKTRGCQVRTVLGLVADLRTCGLLGNKHIPADYLRASREQRLALLQGLMDTDGCWNRTRNCAQIVSTSKAFASSVHELVLSLGHRSVMSEATHTGFKDGTHYTVVFTPHSINPFRLSRKADLVDVPRATRARRRVVHSVEPTLTVPTKCIAVDSPDRTYLCTEAMIPTHNTGGELDVKGVYPEAALQMSAYGHAEFAQLRDGTRVPMPPIAPKGVVLHLRPEGYRLIEANVGDDVFAQFLALRALDAQWTTDLSKRVIGRALDLDAPGGK